MGADGATHAGSFDVTYLACLPDFVVMAVLTRQSSSIWWRRLLPDDWPSAFGYPGEGFGVDMPEIGVPLEIGKGRILREGTIALLNLGGRMGECLEAANEMASLVGPPQWQMPDLLNH